MALLNICNVVLSKSGRLLRLLQHSYLKPLCIDLHCELTKVTHILLEIVVYDTYILVKLSFSISKHQLFLTLVVLYSLHIYNNNCNASKIPILDIICEFLDGTSSSWTLKIDNTTVVDSTMIVTMYMSHLSKPCLDFDSMPKEFTIKCMHLYMR
jgi:hypothetical protein